LVPESTDLELMARLACGDVVAFAGFYDRYATLLFSIAMKVLDDVQEAEDVLQDSARLIWEKAALYNPGLGKPSSWAIAIVRNKAIDRLRELQRKSQTIARLSEVVPATFATQMDATSSEVACGENRMALRNALFSLPPDQRVAIELAFFGGLSQSEIAGRLGEPLGTIKARIRRGMLAMREILEDQL
jgi:RNA polymerase sigma-70 factor, ECF subfamily